MNRTILLISFVAALLAAGCVKESGQSETPPVTKVGVSLAEVATKTWLDPQTDETNIRKVYWSEGDVINVNGFPSIPLTAEQADKSVADFLFYNGEAPFSVIYPASVCENSSYDQDGAITITIPSVQEYSPTSFGNGAAILYGYGEEQPVMLNNLCGAVQVTLKDAATKIVRAVLFSNGGKDTAPVAGSFRLNPQTGECTVLSGVGSISLDVSEVALEAEGQSFYFAVPKGEYPEGFTFRFYDELGTAMECKWLDDSKDTEHEGVTVKGGRLYEFKPVDFVPGGMTILSEADWLYIAEQINDGNDAWKKLYLDSETNSVRLGADIVLPADAPEISEFAAILDGCRHTITIQGALKPLVRNLTGGIKDLTIAGNVTAYAVPAEGEAAALVPFADVLEGGTLEYCTNKVNISIESCVADAAFAGFVKTAKGGTIRGCVNEGNISVVSDCSSTSRSIYGGGFVAMATDLSSQLLVNDCTNKGSIYVKVSVPVESMSLGAKDVGVGGIIGRIHSGDTDKYVKISDCTNEKELKLDCCEATSKAATYQYSLGGIVGLSASLTGSKLVSPVSKDSYYLVVENCSNTAPLYHNSITRCGSGDIDSKIFTGGIAGALFGLKDNHAVISGCTNTGAVVPYIGGYYRQAFMSVCGGLVGVGGYLDITGGKVDAVVGSTGAFSFAQAGIIGTVLTTFSISGVEVSVDIQMAEAEKYTLDNYALAVTSNKIFKSSLMSLSGSKIEKCRFKGSFAISRGAYSSSSLTLPAPGTPVSVTEDDFMDFIVSKSYTGTDIIVSDDNTFLN